MRRPYLRPVDPRWWAKRPYLAYTLREATGIAIGAYALILLAGALCLAAGETAYNAWLEFLATRWSLALHTMILIAMMFHVLTWFAIMPKTMPRLVIGGHYLQPRLITVTGIGVATLASLALLAVALWIQP